MDFPARIPFADHLKLELRCFEAGRAQVALSVREELCNSWDVAHGGAVMTLLDVAMAHAARAPDEPGGPPGPSTATVEMKTTFMQPGVGRLLADAEVLHRTKSFAFCAGAAFDEDGRLVAHATGTFKYLGALPVRGGKVRRANASD